MKKNKTTLIKEKKVKLPTKGARLGWAKISESNYKPQDHKTNTEVIKNFVDDFYSQHGDMMSKLSNE
jgi:hypothetical protein